MGSKNKVKWANRYNNHRNNQREREKLPKRGPKHRGTTPRPKYMSFRKGDSLERYGYYSRYLFELTISLKK